MYERVEHWDIYISVSAFQGHFGKRLTVSDLMSLGKVFHCTKNHNWECISRDGLRLSATRGGQSRSRQAIHFVYAGGEVGPQAGTVVLYGRDVFYCQLDYWLFYRGFRRTSCTSCEGLLMRRTSVPSAGISASSSRDRNADLWIRNPRVTPLRDADLWIRRPARALRQSQDADLWIRHLARRERAPNFAFGTTTA